LVREEGYGEACKLLQDLGFDTPLAAGGSVLTAETLFKARPEFGISHEIDLHGKLTNSAALSRAFSHQELLGRSVELPKLGRGARRISDVDSLLIACLHRKVHCFAPYYVGGVAHLTADRLIWLLDIKKLCERLSASEWELAWSLANSKGLVGVCNDAFQAVEQAFGLSTPVPWVSPEGDEVPARYVASGPVQRLVMDLQATQGFSRKAAFVRQLLFPPPAYMRAAAGDRVALLPWYYLRRIGRGIVKYRRADAP
jgi:hypothetical protein